MPNTITISGNTGKDAPDLRYTPSGAPVLNVRGEFANVRYDKNSNEWVKRGDPLWLTVVAWHEVAEDAAERHVRESPHRGPRRITCTGHLEARTYENRDGEKRTVIEMHADSIYVHPPRVRQANDTSAPGWGGGQQQQGDPWQQPGQQQQWGQQGQPRQGGWGQRPNDEPPF